MACLLTCVPKACNHAENLLHFFQHYRMAIQWSYKYEHIVKYFTCMWYLSHQCVVQIVCLYYQGNTATSSIRQQQLPILKPGAAGRKCLNLLKKCLLVTKHTQQTKSCFIKPSEETEAFEFNFCRSENESQHS